MHKRNNEKKRFLKFAIVGISGTIVDFLFFNLFLKIGFNTVPASALSFAIAVFNNFFWNRNWTYPESKNNTVGSQLAKFGLISTIGLIVRSLILKLIETPLIIFSSTLIGVKFPVSPDIFGKNLALSIVIVMILFWNYIANRFWTYKDI